MDAIAETIHSRYSADGKEQTMSGDLHKYKYVLFGKIYFILLTEKEREAFERKYRIPLQLWD